MLVSGSAYAAEHPALPLSLDKGQIESYKLAVQPLLAMSEGEMLKLVPAQSGLYFVGCVNCNGGMQEGQLSKWEVKEPNVVRCAFCGHAYPSDKYPMDKVLEVKNPRGEVQRYPYYESRPTWWHEQEPYRGYFTARVDEHKMRYMENAANALARLHALTKEATYARRAALILHRFAEVFPGYCYHFDYPFQQKVIHEGDVNPKDFRAGYRTARWTWWAYMDISRKLLEAYDLIASSGEVEKLSEEKKVSAGADIERLLALAAEQV
ncbi:MAG: heparinase, partial [Armatimonadetes bacterium]|nr:heparinase [Armatimonadota bacterium]